MYMYIQEASSNEKRSVSVRACSGGIWENPTTAARNNKKQQEANNPTSHKRHPDSSYLPNKKDS
jgi:hypothetical protein